MASTVEQGNVGLNELSDSDEEPFVSAIKSKTFRNNLASSSGGGPSTLLTGGDPSASRTSGGGPDQAKGSSPFQKFRSRALKESCCIFKIPEFLTRNEHNSYGYKPTIVSIGPYHRGKQQLQSIEEHKEKFLEFFISQAKGNPVTKDNLIQAVAVREHDIRDSYSEDLFGFPPKDLIDMMVLDGCFLLTLFLTVSEKFKYDDPIFSLSWVLPSLRRDILLLENQLPLFVLQILLDTTNSPSKTHLNAIILKFLSYSFEIPRALHYNNDAKHILHLIRQVFIPNQPETTVCTIQPETTNTFLKLILSAKTLRNSGIKIKPKNTTVNTFLDISLIKGELQIPRITLDDSTSLLLLNCIAFEQFCAGIPNHVTSYAMFMGCLINNERDASFLEEKGIIQNYFGTEEEVPRFFKRICKDYAFDINKSYLAHVFEGVNMYTANGCHVFWAGFWFNYFASPWIFVSTLAALTLLVLTFLQVIL